MAQSFEGIDSGMFADALDILGHSGAMVGLLAAGGDMIGTTGQSSGTGVLLTVGIMIRMYEQIGKEQMMEMHPVLRQFFGEE